MEANNNHYSREDLVYIIDLASQADRHDDVWQGIKQLAKMDGEFTREDRSQFESIIATYESAFRSAYCTTSKKEEQLKDTKDRKWELCTIYLQKLKDEHVKILMEALNIIDNDILPKLRTVSEIVFWYKRKGDYWMQIQTESTAIEAQDAINHALISYETGIEYAKKLDDLDEAKLRLILSYSIFIYERLNDPLRAITTTSEAFNAALAKIDALEGDQFDQISFNLCIMRDAILRWTSNGFDPKTGQLS